MTAHDRAQLARVAARIREQLEALEKVVGGLAEGLERWDELPKDPITVHWLGGLVHDLYTGLEKAFGSISPELNGVEREGATWHRELLHAMTLELGDVRPAVLRRDLEAPLAELLRFRHLYRNLYSFDLRWDRVRALAEVGLRAWPDVAEDLRAFADRMDALAQA